MNKKKPKKWEQLNIGGKVDQAGSSIKYQTGSWRNKIPIYNKKNCDQCGDCVAFCPEDCIIVKNGRISHIDFKFCKGCGICARECPKCFKMKRIE